MENIYAQMIQRIIKEQRAIIGPVAFEVVDQIKGLKVDKKTLSPNFKEADQVRIINNLVKGYESLFGRASVEVCRDAVKDLVAKMEAEEVPTTLQ